MEFGERKRRRKSQSFKLVTDEDSDTSYMMNSSCKYAKGEPKDAAVPDVWVGDEGMEIKRQITGMMRLLSDKTSRVYQRAGTEQDSLTKEAQDRHLTWVHQPAPLSLVSEHHQSNSWNSAGDPGPSPSSISTPILNSPGCGQYSTRSKSTKILTNTKDLIKVNEANGMSEVRLAEDYDVFISKAQLDSILVNYTRSGSLLFRKLVCAFFDDATLANSLPNGKRKRGLNDNRKGLDQNIVGAIKDAAEAEEVSNGPSTSCDHNKPASVKGTVVNMTG
ncbi:BEN domain-containing protein 7 [Collichthys lucidus]|uniref:BEN domain-containing protein 7 n=1 Tax=Collichthys lucidus TaxID=240159 RepID=A0A4U5UF79_COLLU|nr:BEN domain-containing protein 7 [Collichthys lucidus]